MRINLLASTLDTLTTDLVLVQDTAKQCGAIVLSARPGAVMIDGSPDQLRSVLARVKGWIVKDAFWSKAGFSDKQFLENA